MVRGFKLHGSYTRTAGGPGHVLNGQFTNPCLLEKPFKIGLMENKRVLLVDVPAPVKGLSPGIVDHASIGGIGAGLLPPDFHFMIPVKVKRDFYFIRYSSKIRDDKRVPPIG